ncbi:MAG: TlyA family RNA methyltransferase [Nitrospirae bacterium]|nr:TlyA family RNA methyltransferase [Nitrospirota bacterium]
MKNNKIRLDKFLFEKGLAESREKARALILGGNILVNGIKADKAGTLINDDAPIEILQKMPYVSRGGLKLEAAIRDFEVDVRNKIAMDVGASTGGFTDCLLKHGAKKVYAIDVGYGQFDYKLRNDPHVILLEKTNIRYLDEKVRNQSERPSVADLTLRAETRIGKSVGATLSRRLDSTSGDSYREVRSKRLEDLKEKNIDIAVIDVSFISLLKVIPVVSTFLKPGREIIALIKPQFEAGREHVGKGGVVRDKAKRFEVVEKIKTETAKMGFGVKGLIQSPITGPKGNVEYLIYLKKR